MNLGGFGIGVEKNDSAHPLKTVRKMVERKKERR